MDKKRAALSRPNMKREHLLILMLLYLLIPGAPLSAQSQIGSGPAASLQESKALGPRAPVTERKPTNPARRKRQPNHLGCSRKIFSPFCSGPAWNATGRRPKKVTCGSTRWMRTWCMATMSRAGWRSWPCSATARCRHPKRRSWKIRIAANWYSGCPGTAESVGGSPRLATSQFVSASHAL